jgi:FixJ family two-component response regulator
VRGEKDIALKDNPASSTPAKVQPTLYVVDPDGTVRDDLRVLFEGMDFRVEACASAERFLDVYRPRGAQCLVMEIDLPGMSGLRLLGHLRSQASDLPIIILASRADVPRAVEAMRGGAIDFIEKPFVHRVLVQRVKHALEKSGSVPD